MKMAASELNNRLDYLISYSSQLVFVCSDKIQQQSQVVESFLEHQNEQADLALLTANELTPLVIYREKLFRQLISQSQDADFNRPLNQLLAPLNNHNGRILISIFHAEKLPEKLVKELWDLVLQSRFANNKQHLNVLLMGLSDWAESAKLGLGAKSKDQPIVLNNQNYQQQSESHEFSDLESFIQDKRKKFAQRIEGRHVQSYVSQPIYKKWWVATLFGLVFLAVFAGILSWQYPEKVSSMVSYITAQLSSPEQSVETSDVSIVVESTPVTVAQEAPLPIEELEPPTNAPITTKISTKDKLVTDWNTASAKSEEQSNKIISQTGSIEPQAEVKEELLAFPEPPIEIKEVEIQTDTVNDYQVEDKVSFEPVVEQKKLQSSSLEPTQSDNPLTLKHDVLLALPTENYLIQIAAMANISILLDYIKDEQLDQQLWLYKTRRYGADWYVLLKNQHFPSIEDAKAEIATLMKSKLTNSPFVKSVKQVKQEISNSSP